MIFYSSITGLAGLTSTTKAAVAEPGSPILHATLRLILDDSAPEVRKLLHSGSPLMAYPLAPIALKLIGSALVLSTLPSTFELTLLSFAAALPVGRTRERLRETQRLAVIIPAHDHETLIARCVAHVLADREIWVEVYVVAHDCSDRTALRASEAGARVLTVAGPASRSQVLAHGFHHALTGGAGAVLVVDAASFVAPNLMAAVAAALAGGSAAVQTRCQLTGHAATLMHPLNALTLAGRTLLRPRGRSRLGLSAGILTSGYALSARTLARVPYALDPQSGELDYHLRLLESEIRVDFLDHARIYADSPATESAGPGAPPPIRSMLNALRHGNWRMLAPLLERTSLPLASQAGSCACMTLFPLAWVRYCGITGLLVLAFYLCVTAVLSRRPQKP